VLPILRKDLTATAAHPRSAAIRLGWDPSREERRSGLGAAVPAASLKKTQNHFGGICRMPSAPLTLDPSQQEEGRP
jgi:hypothetical protein